jgi:hypothetical protein
VQAIRGHLKMTQSHAVRHCGTNLDIDFLFTGLHQKTEEPIPPLTLRLNDSRTMLLIRPSPSEEGQFAANLLDDPTLLDGIDLHVSMASHLRQYDMLPCGEWVTIERDEALGVIVDMRRDRYIKVWSNKAWGLQLIDRQWSPSAQQEEEQKRMACQAELGFREVPVKYRSQLNQEAYTKGYNRLTLEKDLGMGYDVFIICHNGDTLHLCEALDERDALQSRSFDQFIASELENLCLTLNQEDEEEEVVKIRTEDEEEASEPFKKKLRVQEG